MRIIGNTWEIIMTMIDWRIQGVEIGICNCSWGCPCQFNALPTLGHCSAGAAIHVEHGHFGSTSLDGVNFGGLFKWPGPIHEGSGEAQPLIDERATPEQRNAILTIARRAAQCALATGYIFSR